MVDFTENDGLTKPLCFGMDVTEIIQLRFVFGEYGMKCLVMSLLSLMVVPLSSMAASEEKIENLAVNPGFEDPSSAEEGVMPSDWITFTSKGVYIELDRELKRNGEQAVKMTTQHLVDGYQGLSQKLPVTEGEKYTFSAFIISDKRDPLGGTGHFQLVIEWHNDAGKEIGRKYSPVYDSSISKLRWDSAVIRNEQVPAGATLAIFGLHLSEGKKGGKGAILVDDVLIQRQ